MLFLPYLPAAKEFEMPYVVDWAFLRLSRGTFVTASSRFWSEAS